MYAVVVATVAAAAGAGSYLGSTRASQPVQVVEAAPAPIPSPTSTPVAPQCYVSIFDLFNQTQPTDATPKAQYPEARVSISGPQYDWLCLAMVREGKGASQAGRSNYHSVICERGVGGNVVRVWADERSAGEGVCANYDQTYAGRLSSELVRYLTIQAARPPLTSHD
jgi:hypothetical protein